jgi:hypothetical protein
MQFLAQVVRASALLQPRALGCAAPFQDQQESPKRPRCSGSDPTVRAHVEASNRRLRDHSEEAIRPRVPRNIAVSVEAVKRSNLAARVAHVSLLRSIDRLIAYGTYSILKRAEEWVLVADLLGCDVRTVCAKLARPSDPSDVSPVQGWRFAASDGFRYVRSRLDRVVARKVEVYATAGVWICWARLQQGRQRGRSQTLAYCRFCVGGG